jgi:hypothetical protein
MLHLMQLPIQPSNLHGVYEEGKFWIGFATAVIGGYKAFSWVKDLREKDLVEVNSKLDGLHIELGTQTSAIVKATEANTNELKELRMDMRTLIIQPQLARAAKASRRKR